MVTNWTRYRLSVLLAHTASALCGCQSGYVGRAELSDDQSVLAYSDQTWQDRIYVADLRGVRCVAHGDVFALSGNGRWLAVIGGSSQERFPKGSPVLRLDLGTGRRASTTLPTIVEHYDETPHIGEPTSFDVSNPAMISIDNQGLITIGPARSPFLTWDGEGAWRHSPTAGPRGAKLAHGSVPEHVQEKLIVSQIFPPTTTWRRPDGSELCLLRRNDEPVYLLVPPLYVIVALAFGVIGPIVSIPYWLIRDLSEPSE